MAVVAEQCAGSAQRKVHTIDRSVPAGWRGKAGSIAGKLMKECGLWMPSPQVTAVELQQVPNPAVSVYWLRVCTGCECVLAVSVYWL